MTIQHLWDGGRCRAGEACRLDLEREADPRRIRLSIDAPFHDDPAPTQPAGRCPGLWEFEVVELFLVGADGHYLELEFGPKGHYLVLQMEALRRPRREELHLSFETRRLGERWRGDVVFPAAWLPDRLDRWNAFAIHGIGDERRYLAAHPLPGDTVDFHQPHRFPSLDGLTI